ncbi:hypothetical protein A3K01_03905 [candidate division WWE3 bacterium RIFOXYD1_FULL_43_17]|uniref:Uncharacterized protein n=3 Tax=Katanobacteria TaxID=422282 RepID=A0A1F4XF91_UNCKA|nr:MAG: hypothetical protein UU59_C0001G0036 [candidate division WWE3 bacterium GW2011_GWE1_41_27]KKS60739.1 MAG: hypothetical protein UV26_C0002G0065 [candidate division WWE3 bacterium GW2011_GWF2_42_42]OGC80320.1 MAG: hypothetical protein A3K01_03905 [candidate division WWE3 bacterium RIFOXYD1_FULL_43_17]
MFNTVCINSVGLILDIIAGLMLWKYGLPENINRKGEQALLLEGIDEAEKRKAKKYDSYSKIAVILLVIGFFLQLISNYI